MIKQDEYDKIFSQVPRLCVDLLFAKDNKVLLGKRTHEPYKGVYGLPGGRLHFGESVVKGIIRIAARELGVAVSNYNLFDYIEYQQEIQLSNRHSVSLVFSCKTENKIPEYSDDFSELKYVDNLDKINIIQEQRNSIKKYLQKV